MSCFGIKIQWGGSFNKDNISSSCINSPRLSQKIDNNEYNQENGLEIDMNGKVVEVNVRNRMNVNEQYKNVCLKWMK